MKLWKLTNNTVHGYDTYDACVVAAETEGDARQINPSRDWKDRWSGWCREPADVQVEYLGIADREMEAGVILASFNAG